MLTSRCPDAILVTPIPIIIDISIMDSIKYKPPFTPHNRCSTLYLTGNCAELTFLKIGVKYCEDTRPGHQLEASSKQHETMQALGSQEGYTILLGVGGSIYTSKTWRSKVLEM